MSTFQRPWSAPGIGWVLAVVALVVGALVLLDVVAPTPHVEGLEFVLLAGAVLL